MRKLMLIKIINQYNKEIFEYDTKRQSQELKINQMLLFQCGKYEDMKEYIFHNTVAKSGLFTKV